MCAFCSGVDLERLEEFGDEREHVWLEVGWGVEEVVEGHVQAGQGEVLIHKQQHQLEVVQGVSDVEGLLHRYVWNPHTTATESDSMRTWTVSVNQSRLYTGDKQCEWWLE